MSRKVAKGLIKADKATGSKGDREKDKKRPISRSSRAGFQVSLTNIFYTAHFLLPLPATSNFECLLEIAGEISCQSLNRVDCTISEFVEREKSSLLEINSISCSLTWQVLVIP
ncbi:hypothetical protein SAY87_006253 [Trapa incisa]|uniref:Uncharacterized protein n=1 Tax=Trapa incisa TaxID=236973 RepID=A0AAN7KCF1_9MYRT|nr:hypothetical protein SAY87_006225 [Trapa incisa]KAK4761360.1 hypothetical protein SAY87_006253 [Trapa incisa]